MHRRARGFHGLLVLLAAVTMFAAFSAPGLCDLSYELKADGRTDAEASIHADKSRTLALTKENRLTEALRVSELVKARSFTERLAAQLSRTVTDVPAEAAERDRALNGRLAAMKRAMQKAVAKGKREKVQSLDKQVQEAERELAKHIDSLWKLHPDFAAARYPTTIDLTRSRLKDDEWGLAYDVSEKGLVVFLIHGKEIVKTSLKELPSKEVESLVAAFRRSWDVSAGDDIAEVLKSFDFAASKRLADLLVGEMLPLIPAGAPLIVMPDECLWRIPFDALVLNEGGTVDTTDKIPTARGAEFLGDRNPISYEQSVAALTFTRLLGSSRPPGDRTLVLADPVFSEKDPRRPGSDEKKRKRLQTIPGGLMSAVAEPKVVFVRLPLTGKLAESLKHLDPEKTDVYTGTKATKQVLLGRPLNEYGTLVIATHAYAGTELPELREPVMVLSLVDQKPGSDGFLRLSEVCGLSLNADLVFVVCDATLDGPHVAGAGIMSMGAAFRYAGARSVIGTVGPAVESVIVRMAESFFRLRKAGKSKVEALSLAKKEIRSQGFDHPFFWAGLILVGEPN